VPTTPGVPTPNPATPAEKGGAMEPVGADFAASASPCPSGNLIMRARITAPGATPTHHRLRDGWLAMEGADWQSPYALPFPDRQSSILFDLGAPRDVRYLVLQGDNNDLYPVEGSEDGVAYRPLWTAPDVPEQGLRTRWTELPKAKRVRHLRVQARAGDGYFSISEFRAFCVKPKPWPPELKTPPRRPGLLGLWDWLDNDKMVQIKGATAALATLLFALAMFLRWWGRPRKFALARDLTLAFLGLFSLASWWNLGHFHFNHYIHIWEHYHYYMGAKYGPELRYARLYECTAAADLEDGLRSRVQKRKMRDLGVDNELHSSDAIIADPKRCTSHFTPARWHEFRKDIRFFRGRFSRDRWDQSQTDHGYNGTPVWAIAGKLITDYGGELNWKKIEGIAAVDSILLGLMWLVAWWAFGWRATCVALVWWGTNFPARFYWNGGSFLRYDWIVWLVVGLCLLRKDKPFFAGIALTYATLLRVFPGFVVATLVLKALARMVRERRFVLSREHQSFALGCIVALGTLIPASSWATGGLDAWGEFAHNSQKHLKTALTNNMGLKTVLGFDWTTRARMMRNDKLEDPFGEWKDARGYFYEKREPLLIGLLILFCLMLARAADREPSWAAACLGTGLIALAAELTCYYYGFLLGYGLLWGRRMLPGLAMTLLAALTCWISLIAWNDEHFGLMSLLCSLVIVGVTAHVAFGKSPEEADAGAVDRAPAKPARVQRTGGAPGLAST
jgi:hypothetical protein